MQYPEIEEIRGIIGDADGDANITIMDTTTVQKYLAKIITEIDFEYKLCDCDNEGSVNITDATYIQFYLAHIDRPLSLVGQKK